MTTENDGRDAATVMDQNKNGLAVGNDESEILGLHNAIEKVLTKIRWHEDQIEERRQDIKGHEDQIEELRVSLRKHVGPLMNQSLSHHRPAPPKNSPRKKTVASETVTSDLIVDCLTKQGKPVNTKVVKDFLEKQGNHTNPSVELSRMVKRGQIERAGRGLYQLKK